jgi:hypothetical protein
VYAVVLSAVLLHLQIVHLTTRGLESKTPPGGDVSNMLLEP